MGLLLIICFVLTLILGCIAINSLEEWAEVGCGAGFVLCCILLVVGFFTGFANVPPTEGTHIGVVTAVDLEGVYFRRYQIYLKSSGYTNQSDETIYLLYDYEKELAEELKKCLGKEVKLTYGHDGGYIAWNECGTYHIKSFEKIKE